MKRPTQWWKVVDIEAQRWSLMTYEQLLSALSRTQAYEVEFESKKYQVEVEILENTERYLHVMVAVDDGSLPTSILPASRSFICKKQPANF